MQDVREHQLLMLLLMVQPDLDQRFQLRQCGSSAEAKNAATAASTCLR
jgi:hypothetical protein